MPYFLLADQLKRRRVWLWPLTVGYGAQPKALLYCDPFIDAGGLDVEDYSLWQYNPLSA